jgi:amidohydrolase
LTTESVESALTAAIQAERERLVALSLDIHDHPETNYQERYAAARLTEVLAGYGLTVTPQAGGVETAFRAEIVGSRPGPTVAVIAEYDALPDVGHGCGHNLIATSAVGAAVALKAVADQLSGKVVIIGTPAEEGGGGKIRLLDAGVFADVDAAIMAHPGANETTVPVEPGTGFSLAMVGFRFIFRGKAAHAAARPEDGINALNAVRVLFDGIDAYRQHVRADVRMHGYISDGGVAANVVPAFAAANFMFRSSDGTYLQDVIVPQVHRIAQGAGLVTGAQVEIEPYYPFYASTRPNRIIARQLMARLESVGLPVQAARAGGGASTDFGNVSQALPSTGISFAIAPGPIPGHSIEKTTAAATPFAQEVTLQVADALARTTWDLLQSPDLLAAARAEFAGAPEAHR